MCRVLKVHRSGYYAWKKVPQSKRSIEDTNLIIEIQRSFDASQQIYGGPRVYRDLREDGIVCGENRVARLMCQSARKIFHFF